MTNVRRWAGLAVHPRSPVAARFAARLVQSHVAARRSTAAGRVTGALAGAGRLVVPGRWEPRDQAVFDGIRERWPEAAAAVVLDRSAARTMFVFGDGPHPLVVAKTPGGGTDGVAREEAALTRAAPAGVAPAPLGWVAGAFVQSGLAGGSVDVPAVPPPAVPSLPWPPALAQVADALARLDAATRVQEPPAELAVLETALADPRLSARARARGAAAAADVAARQHAVVRHGDLSPQNVLVDGTALTGLVDWETAVPSGVPGFDVLHAAVSWFEHAVRRDGGGDEAVAGGFDVAWASAPFFAAAREAAGGEEAVLVGFFLRRLGRRLEGGRDPRPARRMLEAVCRA